MAAYSNGPQLDAGPLSTACSQGHRRLRILVLRFRLPCDIVMVTTTFCRHLKHYIKAATMPDTVPTRPGALPTNPFLVELAQGLREHEARVRDEVDRIGLSYRFSYHLRGVSYLTRLSLVAEPRRRRSWFKPSFQFCSVAGSPRPDRWRPEAMLLDPKASPIANLAAEGPACECSLIWAAQEGLTLAEYV